jgi:hypothetical protein
MRVYFLKDFKQDDRLFKAGTDATLWDASEALKGFAVPYEQKRAYESQTKPEAAPESRGTQKASSKKTAAKSKN